MKEPGGQTQVGLQLRLIIEHFACRSSEKPIGEGADFVVGYNHRPTSDADATTPRFWGLPIELIRQNLERRRPIGRLTLADYGVQHRFNHLRAFPDRVLPGAESELQDDLEAPGARCPQSGARTVTAPLER